MALRKCRLSAVNAHGVRWHGVGKAKIKRRHIAREVQRMRSECTCSTHSKRILYAFAALSMRSPCLPLSGAFDTQSANASSSVYTRARQPGGTLGGGPNSQPPSSPSRRPPGGGGATRGSKRLNRLHMSPIYVSVRAYQQSGGEDGTGKAAQMASSGTGGSGLPVEGDQVGMDGTTTR